MVVVVVVVVASAPATVVVVIAVSSIMREQTNVRCIYFTRSLRTQ